MACPQVPPVAAQFNREPRRQQRGRYELYSGSRQGSISSDRQVELDMTCLPNKTEQGKGLPSTECKSKQIIAGSMGERLASLENKSEKLIMELPIEQSQNVTSLLPLPGEGRGIQRIHKDSMSIEEIEEQLWPDPIELQLVPGHTLEVHPKIQQSNSEINSFWWNSVGSKDLWPEDENEHPKSCEEYIDCMYNQLFGSSNINTEALSTSQEYEEWIDQTSEETFCSTPLPKLYDQDKSIQEEELTMEKLEAGIEWFYPVKTRSPAQQEQTNICSDHSVVMPSLEDVQPYTAWNPSISLEGNLSSEQVEKTTGDFTICQISPSSSLIIPITLQDRSIKAVVDTAAMVTVISDEIYRGMKLKPRCLKATSLQTAGRDMKMAGRIVGPLLIKLGAVTFPAVVHVAPINNDMLLGLDFLLKIGANINLKELHLLVTGATEKVPLEIKCTNTASHTISKVTAEVVEQISSINYLHIPHTSESQQKDEYWRDRLDYPLLFNNQDAGGHKYQKVVVSPVTMSNLPTTGHTNHLETEAESLPELNYFLCCRQEIAQTSSMKYIQGEQDLYQSKCLVKSKMSVLWLVDDERQWPWDPGGC